MVTSELVLPCSSMAKTPTWYAVPSINGAEGVPVEDASLKADDMFTVTGVDVPASTLTAGVRPAVELNGCALTKIWNDWAVVMASSHHTDR